MCRRRWRNQRGCVNPKVGNADLFIFWMFKKVAEPVMLRYSKVRTYRLFTDKSKKLAEPGIYDNEWIRYDFEL